MALHDAAMSRGRFRLVAVALAAVAGGCGGGGNHDQTRLSIRADNDMARYDFTLRCNPAAGSVPDPVALCATLTHQPMLVETKPGFDHSCPFNRDVHLVGIFEGQRVEKFFSICRGGTEALANQWMSLLHVPQWPLQRVGGRIVEGAALISDSRAATRLRYIDGSRLALAYLVENVSSVRVTIASITLPSVIRSPVRLIGVRLGRPPAGGNAALRAWLIAPTMLGSPPSYTLRPHEKVAVQENFQMGGCRAFVPGRAHADSDAFRLDLRIGDGEISGLPLSLSGDTITTAVPPAGKCPR
jgi:hypothetical protein